MLALVAAGCSSNSGSSSSGNTPVKGGTAVWAEPPSSSPTYIFPYTDSADESNINNFEFQYLMYRPLYWFGQNGQPVVNYALSVANPPTVNGKTLTITLKHYMWSDGTQVTAQDVVFWLNMELAVPQDFGSYNGFPANTTNIKVVSPTELQLTMDKPYSLTWFLYNELSQVTPMPTAWDRTASGPSHCDTTVSDCAAVYKYLAGQAKDLYPRMRRRRSGASWTGPWKLSSFNADGHNTFVPNKAYTGPVKPKLVRVRGGAVHHGLGRVRRAALTEFQHQDRRGVPADPGRPGQAGQRDGGLQPRIGLHHVPAVPVGHQLLRAELPVQRRRPRRHLQAALLPAGDAVRDEPVRDHHRPAARLRGSHRGPGRQRPRRRSGCRPRAGRATRIPTTRPRPRAS